MSAKPFGEVTCSPVQAQDIDKGSFVMMMNNTRPCKVVTNIKSNTGKHGHTKCLITGIDLANGKKYTMLHPGDATLETFAIQKHTVLLIDILDRLGNDLVCLTVQNQEYIVASSDISAERQTRFVEQIIKLFKEGKTVSIVLTRIPFRKSTNTSDLDTVTIIDSFKEDKPKADS